VDTEEIEKLLQIVDVKMDFMIKRKFVKPVNIHAQIVLIMQPNALHADMEQIEMQPLFVIVKMDIIKMFKLVKFVLICVILV
jgi:hypothetical protein